ncbi:hypothetical protein EVAR_7372_1 [Eumeta japonica]|uniref:Uncharacterized protein n=1 Tax=Eumeta variegata TaxID=151549 RepID=A0A4C1V686_EUMVA|nr:hypothetical protein EVAR_7372_1 [Eumeta japonica]
MPETGIIQLISATTANSSRASNREHSPAKGNKRQASLLPDDNASCSDNTIVGPDNESEKSFTFIEIQFHTYALEEERNLKAVIRGNPVDFITDDIQFNLFNQDSLCTRCTESLVVTDYLWLFLAVLPKIEEAKLIFKNLKGCPKAPKIVPKSRPNSKRPTQVPTEPARDDRNFPALVAKNPTRSPGDYFHPTLVRRARRSPNLPTICVYVEMQRTNSMSSSNTVT